VQEPAPGGGEAQADTGEATVPLGDEIAAVRGSGISPAQEVQVVPGAFVEIARRREPFGLAPGAVEKRSADVPLGE
jgi:hypothetical protein